MTNQKMEKLLQHTLQADAVRIHLTTKKKAH